jgi:hypothetical protein
VLHLDHNFVGCWNLDTSESRPEIPGKFSNMVLEMDSDQLDRSCEKWSTAELSYNNFGLSDISAIALNYLWYQLIPHEVRVFLPRLVRHTVRESTSDTTLKKFQEIDYFENSIVSSSSRRQAVYSLRQLYTFQAYNIAIVTVIHFGRKVSLYVST